MHAEEDFLIGSQRSAEFKLESGIPMARLTDGALLCFMRMEQACERRRNIYRFRIRLRSR